MTRGDNSGTHLKERELWERAGVTPTGDWYLTLEPGGAGNTAATRHSEKDQTYVLTDRATYLVLKQELILEVLVEKDPDLLNLLAVIRVNPATVPGVNAHEARAFADWLVSEEAQAIIQAFGVTQYGEPLYLPNSAEWRRRHPAT